MSNHDATHAWSAEALWSRGRHNIMMGGDSRIRRLDVFAQQDARGTFGFTGAATGSDLADFLLGLPRTSAIAFGNADKLFRGKATTSMLLRFFYYQTPLFLYYIIPIAVLVATLVTIGVMTKNSELVVMKACGMSLYRVAAPLVLFAVGASAALFGLQETVLARAQRHADRRKRDVGRRIERKDDDDGDRQQQERNDRAVERQIGRVPCVEAPAHAICLSPVSRPRIVL